MLANLAGFILVVCIGVCVFVGVKLLLKPNWFVPWIRANCALLTFCMSGWLSLLAYDYMQFTELDHDRKLAEVSITQLAEQSFTVSLSFDDVVKEYVIEGDMWQLDAKVITWNEKLRYLGLDAAIRLDRLSGRYFSIEQEISAERTVYSLEKAGYVGDLWTLVSENEWLPGIEAKFGASTYVPLANGANFDVHVREAGLIASPKNTPAQKAIYNWK